MNASNHREIVLTGYSVVCPIGIGREAYWESMQNRQSGLGPITQFEAGDYPANIAGEIKEFDPKQYVRPRKSLKVMCRDIQISFAAADLAITHAGLDDYEADPDRYGVIFGADMMYSPAEEVVDAYQACLTDGKFDFDRWGGEAMRQLFPLWMLKYLPNMPACHIAIARDARGPCNTIMLSEVSALLAVMEGKRALERGVADIMVVGGGSCRNHPGAFVFRGHHHLSHRIDDPASASRPFDATRDGTVNSEGAAAFVLETRAHAEARGAKIIAQVTAANCRIEPVDEQRRPTGLAIRNSIQAVLEEAGLQADAIGHVNANGLATVEDDAIEATAIRDMLGDVPVTAPKSFLGNPGAGAGALEMVASVLALEHGEVPVTLNYREPDPKCPVNVVADEPLKLSKSASLILNQSTTGQAAAVILDAPS